MTMGRSKDTHRNYLKKVSFSTQGAYSYYLLYHACQDIFLLSETVSLERMNPDSWLPPGSCLIPYLVNSKDDLSL